MHTKKGAGNPIFQTLIQTGMFDDIPRREYTMVFRQLTIAVRDYEKDETIFSQGQKVDRLGVIHEGIVRAETQRPDGSKSLIQMYSPGKFFAMEAVASKNQTAPMAYISNKNTTVILVSMSSITHGVYAALLMKGFLQELAHGKIRKVNKIETLSKRCLRERIMSFLHTMEEQEGKTSFSIHMNKTEMADYLCVNRSAMSNELNKMREEKLIDFDKNIFRILEKQ